MSRPRVSIATSGLTVVGLVLSSAALFPLLAQTRSPTFDAYATKLWICVYALVGFLALRRTRELIDFSASNPAIAAIVLYAATSVAWSSDGVLSAQRAAELLFVTCFAVLAARALGSDRFAAVLCWTLGAIVALSAAVAVLAPRYGLDHIRGDVWRGVFTTKNELGRIAALTAVVWGLRLLKRGGRTVTAAAFCAGSALVGWEAGSRTALAVGVALAAYFALLPLFRTDRYVAVATASFAFAAAVAFSPWFFGSVSRFALASGSDVTLTGRSAIWTAAWESIRTHEWVGYGYAAFWRGFEGPSAAIWANVPSHPPHAHNAVLDIWLELGVVGVAMLAVAVAVVFVRAAKLALRSSSFEDALPLTLIVFLVLFSWTESTLVPRASLFWIVFVASAAMTTRRELERETRPVVPLAATRRLGEVNA